VEVSPFGIYFFNTRNLNLRIFIARDKLIIKLRIVEYFHFIGLIQTEKMRIKNIFLAFIFVYFELFCCAKGLEPFDDICEGKHNVNIAHPCVDLCTHFFYCYLEIPILFYCEYPTEVFHNGECVAGEL